MKIDELIAKLREQINARITMRNQYATDLEELRAEEITDEVTAKVDALRSKKAGLDAEIGALNARLADLQEEQRQDAAIAALQAKVTPTGARAGAGHEERVVVGDEPRTYAPETDPRGLNFLSDVVASFRNDRDAGDRLSRHMREQRVEFGEKVQRAVTTSGSPGTVVPQYLIDLYAPKGRPGRVFADQCRKHELPATGMAVYIPRQTAKTSTGLQASEMDPVTENDYDDELITVSVRTAAGSQTIARQASERGLGTEDIVFEDLLRAFDSDLDYQLINASTWGLLAVANAVTYTDADPTAAELYRKILGAGANAEDVLLNFDEADLITLMRGRRWSWLNGEVTDKKPFIAQPTVPAEAFGTNAGNPYSSGVRGFLPNGGRVFTDNNLPNGLGTGTNEDVVVEVVQHEAHLWEDPSAPLFIRAEQTQAKKLGIDLVVYGYFAACFNRVVDEQGTPKAVHQKITGTGLVAPTF